MSKSPINLLSQAGSKTFDAFLRRHVSDPEHFVTEISSEDEMYLYELQLAAGNHDEAVLRYFDSGRLMLSEYKPIIDGVFGSFNNVDSLLEFACGHGRFTRYLVQEIAPERVSVSDIYVDAVDFQQKQFGVKGAVSVQYPEDYVSSQEYQLILVSSLFSHLPAETFSRWLGRLYSMLAEGGVLVFTVHDSALLPSGLAVDERGILFRPESESRSLAKSQYGTTFVDESFVSRAIAEACPGTGRYERIKKGLWRYQDVYVVGRNGNVDLSKAGLNRGPRGHLDLCSADESGSDYLMGGWAFDFEEHSAAEHVAIYCGNELLGSCRPERPRPDVAAHFDEPAASESGWECRVDGRELRGDDLISIEAVGRSSRSFVLECETLSRLCARAAMARRR